MENPGLQLMQLQPEGIVMAIDQDATGDPEIQPKPWQQEFSKQFTNLFRRVG